MTIVTIDTDNACIRLHLAACADAVMTRSAVDQLHLDLRTMAVALTHITGADFRVQAVAAVTPDIIAAWDAAHVGVRGGPPPEVMQALDLDRR